MVLHQVYRLVMPTRSCQDRWPCFAGGFFIFVCDGGNNTLKAPTTTTTPVWARTSALNDVLFANCPVQIERKSEIYRIKIRTYIKLLRTPEKGLIHVSTNGHDLCVRVEM